MFLVQIACSASLDDMRENLFGLMMSPERNLIVLLAPCYRALLHPLGHKVQHTISHAD